MEWMKEKDMSPLSYFTERQAEKLSEQIGSDKIIVDFAMRYGNPSIKSKIHKPVSYTHLTLPTKRIV